jgi:hypothetical protein
LFILTDQSTKVRSSVTVYISSASKAVLARIDYHH